MGQFSRDILRSWDIESTYVKGEDFGPARAIPVLYIKLGPNQKASEGGDIRPLSHNFR